MDGWMDRKMNEQVSYVQLTLVQDTNVVKYMYI